MLLRSRTSKNNRIVSANISRWVFCLGFALAGGLTGTALADQVDVTAPGNLLALLPATDLNASTSQNFSSGTDGSAKLTDAVDNFVGTSNADNGQVFADGAGVDTDQRLTITGFDSSVADIRLFSVPSEDIRRLQAVTVYYSIDSTTSIVTSNSDFTGGLGGVLVPTMILTSTSFPGTIAGTDVEYLDLAVNAPAGTRTLLFDFGGTSADNFGDRVSEVQAFATPLPNVAVAGLLLLGGFVFWHQRRRILPL